jgi:HEAT repeat protein
MKTRGEPALQGRDPVKSSILPGGCIGDARWPRVLKMLRDRLVALLRRIPGFLRAVANNKKGWHLRVAISLLSLLSANVAFCLDGEAILKALRDRNADTRRRALESRELAACYSSDADDKNCPPNPELFKRLNDELMRLLKDPDPSIRKVAAQYLSVSTDARAIRPLARLLMDHDDRVRAVAANAFVHTSVQDDNIVSDLEKLLRDHNKEVRAGAAMSLMLNGTRKSLDRLKEAYDHETDSDVKGVFGEAMKYLANRTQK